MYICHYSSYLLVFLIDPAKLKLLPICCDAKNPVYETVFDDSHVYRI